MNQTRTKTVTGARRPPKDLEAIFYSETKYLFNHGMCWPVGGSGQSMRDSFRAERCGILVFGGETTPKHAREPAATYTHRAPSPLNTQAVTRSASSSQEKSKISRQDGGVMYVVTPRWGLHVLARMF